MTDVKDSTPRGLRGRPCAVAPQGAPMKAPRRPPRRPDAPLVATRRDLTQRTEAQRVMPDETPTTKTPRGIPPWPVHSNTEEEKEMSKISRRSLVAGAAVLPSAVTVPAVADTTDAEVLCLAAEVKAVYD